MKRLVIFEGIGRLNDNERPQLLDNNTHVFIVVFNVKFSRSPLSLTSYRIQAVYEVFFFASYYSPVL